MFQNLKTTKLYEKLNQYWFLFSALNGSAFMSLRLFQKKYLWFIWGKCEEIVGDIY